MGKAVEATVEVQFQNSTWVGEWVRYGKQKAAPTDHYLVISKVIEEELIPVHQLNLRYNELNSLLHLITSE